MLHDSSVLSDIEALVRLFMN